MKQEIFIDSSKVTKGGIFVAVVGTKFDGHNFIADAIKNGASEIICQTNFMENSHQAKITLVDDSRAFLAQYCAEHFVPKPPHIVGITGTSGKTSTSSFYKQLIERLGNITSIIGTNGIFVGNQKLPDSGLTTPDILTLHRTLQRIALLKADFVSMEISSHALIQQRVAGITFEAAGFTSFSQDHLDYHKTMESYLQAKLQLFSQTMTDKIAVVNSDLKELPLIEAACRKGNNRVFYYGKNIPDYAQDFLKLSDIKDGFSQQTCIVTTNQKSYHLSVSLIGEFQLYNVLCAAALVHAGGFEFDKIFSHCSELKAPEGRMELVTNSDSSKIVVVDYSHKPDALENALINLRKKTNNLIVILGCGGDRDRGKRPLMGRIACNYANEIIITDDNPRSEEASQIRREILSGCNLSKTTEIGDRDAAIKYAISRMKTSSILLIAGKGHEKYQIIGKQIFDFDDVAVARKYIDY